MAGVDRGLRLFDNALHTGTFEVRGRILALISSFGGRALFYTCLSLIDSLEGLVVWEGLGEGATLGMMDLA